MTNRTRPSRDDLVEILPQLRRFACALVGNRADGDDLVQSTLEKLLVKGVPEGVDPLPWAFRICRNLRIDQARSAEVRARLDPKTVADEPRHEDGEQTMMGRLMVKDVAAAMEELPVEQKAALALVALEGYSYAEAAETLDVSVGTIMSRVYRARQKLSIALEHSPQSLN